MKISRNIPFSAVFDDQDPDIPDQHLLDKLSGMTHQDNFPDVRTPSRFSCENQTSSSNKVVSHQLSPPVSLYSPNQVLPDHDLKWMDDPQTLYLRKKLHIADASSFTRNLAQLLSSTCILDAMNRVSFIAELIAAANRVSYPVFAVDRDGRVITWNPAMEHLTHCAAGEIIGKGDSAYSLPFYGKDHPMLVDYLLHPTSGLGQSVQAVSNNPGTFATQPESVVIHGKFFTLWSRGRRLFDERGNFIAAVQSIGIVDHGISPRTRESMSSGNVNEIDSPISQSDIPEYPGVVDGRITESSPSQPAPSFSNNTAEPGSATGSLCGLLRQKHNILNTAFQDLVSAEDHVIENCGIIADLSPQKADKIKETSFSDEFLSRVIMGAREGIIAYDRSLRCILWNPFMEHLTGIPRENVLGKRGFEMFPSLQSAGADLFLEQALSGQTVESSDISIHSPALGKQAWVRLIFSTLFDNNRTAVGSIVIVQDMTAIKVMEYALQTTIIQLMESEEKYRSIFNAKNEPLILIDPETHFIMDLNNASLDLFGYSRDEMSAIPVSNLFADPEKSLSSLNGKSGGTNLYHMRKKDGLKFPADISSASFMLKDRTVQILSVRDLSSVYQITEALRLANTKLNLLIGITRHDVINNLTALMGYNDLMKNNLTDPSHLAMLEKQETALKIIHRQIEFTREYYDLGVKSPLWQNVCEVSTKAYAQFITITPFACETSDVEIYADPLLEKVFYNLFDNAFRYGQNITRISLSCQQEGDDLILVFCDDGPGILPENKQRIFRRGFGKNTGLGLFLSKEILSITKIEICENGIYGQGARFEFRIPMGSYRFSNITNSIGWTGTEYAKYSVEHLH